MSYAPLTGVALLKLHCLNAEKTVYVLIGHIASVSKIQQRFH